MKIPATHQTVMPYLILEGGSRFIDFMKTVFNAELTHHSMRDEKLLGHCEMQIGGCTIMFSDASPEWKVRNGDFFIYVENADTTYQKALDAGATEVLPLSNQEYGRSGGVTDPFGNIWWITSL